MKEAQATIKLLFFLFPDVYRYFKGPFFKIAFYQSLKLALSQECRTQATSFNPQELQLLARLDLLGRICSFPKQDLLNSDVRKGGAGSIAKLFEIKPNTAISRKAQDHNDGDEKDNCSICLGTIEERNFAKSSCGHLFHLSCISEIIVRGMACPICRGEMMSDPN